MKPRFARLLAGSVLAAAIQAAYAAEPEQPDVIRFDIHRFEVVGNTLLKAEEVNAAVQPFTGKGRDFGDVQQALDALEAAFHARGYNVVTVQLPEQELNGGVVRLNVVQSRIGKISVTGQKHVSDANVRYALPSLREGHTPNLKDVSAGLKLANDNPARKITLKLQSGAEDDLIDARLDVQDEKPWKAMLSLDNTGTEQTGKTHITGMLQHANLWGRDHLASLQYTTTAQEPSKVSVWGAGYHIPLYRLGHSIDLFASYSDIDSGSVSAGLVDLTVSGKGAMYGARYNQILPTRGDLEQRIVYGADIKAFKNNVLFSGQNFGNDITVRPVSVSYLLTHSQPAGQANASVTLVRNLPGGSRGSAADFAAVRSGAKANYTLLRWAAAYSRSMGGDWQMRALVNGQLSADALVPGEQFGAGGASSVRGLDERALSTDSGAAVNLETYTPNFGTGRWTVRALAFVDAAHGRRRAALPGEIRSTSVSSAGVGIRMAMGSHVSLQADAGHVLNAGATGSTSRNKIHVRLALAY
jgi:hemolysin activation/secretion protein